MLSVHQHANTHRHAAAMLHDAYHRSVYAVTNAAPLVFQLLGLSCKVYKTRNKYTHLPEALTVVSQQHSPIFTSLFYSVWWCKTCLILVCTGHAHSVVCGLEPPVTPVLQSIPDVDGDSSFDGIAGQPGALLHDLLRRGALSSTHLQPWLTCQGKPSHDRLIDSTLLASWACSR